MPRKDTANTPASAQAQQEAVSEGIENFELPRALVTRIAKSAVPDNVKLQKDTVLSLVKGATVFINYLGGAHEVSTSKQHKSISASDVFKALELIEFADLIPPLQAELQVYRELAKSKKVSSGAGASSSAPPARNKSSSTAVQRGKGKERVTEVGESSVSAPPPNAPGVPPVQPLPHVQGDDAREGEGDDEDQTDLDQPEVEPDDEAEDMDDVDEDVDMNMDADTREVREVLDDEDEME
ncbi:histone-fold-containing protein [Russula aff. rugulosa BPL654]|nr:histone-fold-containing protein [Russula aff. rugulosa BPL654]